MKKIYVTTLALIMVGALAGCGKKEKKEEADPTAAVRDDVVEFVDTEFKTIRTDWDEAVSEYNMFFTGDMKDSKQFAADLKATTIPKMDKFLTNLEACDVETSEAVYLKSLFQLGAEKQREAMEMVVSAIEEENSDYLTQADALIAEANGYLESFNTQLEQLSKDFNFTINE
ncbi:MAG: hypothetical protein Q4D54_02045 [Eubacteriales bacterium]|nr:hypothetical protein [Lachnospiraceae bacterium]MDO5126513.1 hypothetical protein [Eubacteriales bacterium]